MPTLEVDARVGAQIFRALAQRRHGATVMALNQWDLLPEFDKVVCIADGAVVAFGTPAEIQHLEAFQLPATSSATADDEQGTANKDEPVAGDAAKHESEAADAEVRVRGKSHWDPS